MMFLKEPNNFKPKFDIVSCILIRGDGKFLLLSRDKDKPQPFTWGAPVGKKENGETALEATIREVREETGLNLRPQDVKFYKKTYVRYSDYDFIYNMFYCRINNGNKIKIKKDEHEKFAWVSLEEALKKRLIEDLDNCLIKINNDLDVLK